ncbi:TetR/AcrR family transcriptional regulator [Streptomyces sp. MH13]|uniref:TetR/AcrR family transcriptional regulator n=1 Tax=unclassified Streptomyces TaxID=2593676 RepID=UPI003CEB95B5
MTKAAGISQAYVYRLFPNKEALFTAVVEHCFVRVRAALEGGAAKAESSAPDAVLASMGDAYARLISDNDLMLVQLHAQAAAVSEPAIRDAVRAGYARTVEYVRGTSGAARNRSSSSSPSACSATCLSPSTPGRSPHPGPAP